MVGTILPIGYGDKLRGKRSWALAAFGVGAVGGAAIAGLVTAAAMRLILDALDVRGLSLATGAAGIAAVACGLVDASVVKLPRLTTLRQVPSRWARRYTPNVSSLFYGAGLGVGVLTRAPASFLALILWASFQGDPWIGAAAWGTYGAGRFLALVFVDVRELEEGDSIELTLDRLAVWERVVPLLIGMFAVGAGAYLLTISFVHGRELSI